MTATASVPAADILIVDHDQQALSSLTRLLASQGHWVYQARSGHEALSTMGMRMPDLVIAEVMMLGLDGVDLARAMRSNSIMRDIPVLLVSERDDRETRVRVGEVADDFLVKPLDGLELMFRVNFLLRSRARVRHLHQEISRLTAENGKLSETLSEVMSERTSFDRCESGDSFVGELITITRR